MLSMGNFYTNVSIQHPLNDEVLATLTTALGSGKAIRFHEWTTACSDHMEQNVAQATSLLHRLTKRFNCLGVMFTNHDDDLLVMSVAQAGSKIFTYNSAPGYFDGNDAQSHIEGLEQLISCGLITNPFEVSRILLSNEYTFAHERHGALINLLKFPASSLCASESYLDDGDLPPGVSSDMIVDFPGE